MSESGMVMLLSEMTKERLFQIFGVDESTTMEMGETVKLNAPTDITLEWGGVAHQLKTLTKEDASDDSFLINWTEENQYEHGVWIHVRFNSDGNLPNDRR